MTRNVHISTYCLLPSNVSTSVHRSGIEYLLKKRKTFLFLGIAQWILALILISIALSCIYADELWTQNTITWENYEYLQFTTLTTVLPGGIAVAAFSVFGMIMHCSKSECLIVTNIVTSVLGLLVSFSVGTTQLVLAFCSSHSTFTVILLLIAASLFFVLFALFIQTCVLASKVHGCCCGSPSRDDQSVLVQPNALILPGGQRWNAAQSNVNPWLHQEPMYFDHPERFGNLAFQFPDDPPNLAGKDKSAYLRSLAV